MAIDITKLSSEELFELARKRQQEEQSEAERAAVNERLAELKKMRGLILSKHEDALAATDKAIAELQKKRAAQVADHEETLAGIDKEMQELNSKLERPIAAPPAPAPAPAATESAKPVPPPAAPIEKPAAVSSTLARTAATPATAEEIFNHVRELMLGRSYISESLLKEQLRARKVNITNLHKQLEQLVREERLVSKGGGNYALGKKA